MLSTRSIKTAKNRVMRRICFLWIILVLAGCSQHPDPGKTTGQLPSDSLVSRTKMVKITADVHVLEAVLVRKHIDRRSSKIVGSHYYKVLFSKWGISQDRYRMNIGRLQQDPKDFLAFYEEVLAEMDTRIDSAQKALKKTAGKE